MLQPTFDVEPSADCKNLIFTENTGFFVTTFNEGGYGAPNPELTDVTSVEIDVTTPGATVPKTIIAGSPLPSDKCETFTLTPTLLGTTGVPDGRYVITYRVIGSQGGNPFTITETIQKAFHCNLECLIDKEIAKVPKLRRECKFDQIDNIELLNIFLQGAQDAACCGRIQEHDQIVADINNILEGKLCKC